MTENNMNDPITAADLVAQEAEYAASIAQDEVRLYAKRSRLVAWRYMNGLATAAEAEAAIRDVMTARQSCLTAALRADGAAIVRLLALEEDRQAREAAAKVTP